MPDDVFKEAPFGGDFGNDAGDGRPEVARVILAFPVPREAERLAGITGRDEMNAAAPRFAVEGLEIVPDRSRCQDRVFHPGHESGRGETVSLDITHSAISGFGEVDSEVEASNSGAEAEPSELMNSGGMNSHTRGPFHRRHAAAGVGSLRVRRVASDD